MDYNKGHLAKASEHISPIAQYLMELDEKKYYIKVMEESKYRTYLQIKGFKGLTSILDKSNCMNERIDTVDKVRYYFKLRCGLIKHWALVKEGKTSFHDTKVVNGYAEVKSCSTMLKRELKDLIDAVCIEGDRNVDNMSLEMQKKWVAVRKEMEDKE